MVLFGKNKKRQFLEQVHKELEKEKRSNLICECGHYRQQHFYDIRRRGFEFFEIIWSECAICNCQEFEEKPLN